MVSVKTIHFKFSKFWPFNFSTKLPNLIFQRTFLWNLNFVLSYQKDVILNFRWMKKKQNFWLSWINRLVFWFWVIFEEGLKIFIIENIITSRLIASKYVVPTAIELPSNLILGSVVSS